MNKQNIRIVQSVLLAGALAVTATTTASAAGLLGQRYVGAGLNYVFWDNDVALEDGIGASLVYNQPLTQNVDLSLGYSYLGSDFEGASIFFDDDVTTHDLLFSGTWFRPCGNGKFYARGGLGWTSADGPGGFDVDEAYYLVETGFEFLINDSFTLTPFVNYTDLFESGYDGVFNFGAVAEFDLGNSWSLIFAGSGDDDQNYQTTGGFVYRF